MKNLKTLRKSKNQTQLNLAISIGVQQETISAYESGKAMPTVETLLKICKFYNCSADFLLDLTSVKTPVKDLFLHSLSPQEAELICKYRQLSLENQNKLLGFLEAVSL